MRIFSVLFLNALLIGLVHSPQVLGQVKTQTPQREQTDDVVRVKTELVQTDITVVDKRGRFARGLSENDFELRVRRGSRFVISRGGLIISGIDEVPPHPHT